MTVAAAAPGLPRRLACFVYEGVLLFGVLMISAYLYSSLTQQRHALHGKTGLQAFLFVMLGIYFVWFWSRSGQTVAMKAWHIRLVDTQGAAVTQWRAMARYLLAWAWFVPGLVALYLMSKCHLVTLLIPLGGRTTYVVGLGALSGGAAGAGAMFGVLTLGVMGFAALAYLRPDRQFWHDVVCGTRLVHWQPAPCPKT